MNGSEELCWRVEEACLNAWPSPRHVLVDGYLLRAAGGRSKRINSVNPLRGSGEPETAIAACESIYSGLGRRPIFRVPDIAPQMGPHLDRRGYRTIGESMTLHRALNESSWARDADVGVSKAPAEEWLALRDAVSGRDPETAETFRQVTAAIALPCAYAAVVVPGGLGAIAFCVRDNRLIVIESVAVPEPWRGRGLAKKAVRALLRWGAEAGATEACLQVEASNGPAVAMYRKLGFDCELYRYHYRVRE